MDVSAAGQFLILASIVAAVALLALIAWAASPALRGEHSGVEELALLPFVVVPAAVLPVVVALGYAL